MSDRCCALPVLSVSADIAASRSWGGGGWGVWGCWGGEEDSAFNLAWSWICCEKGVNRVRHDT